MAQRSGINRGFMWLRRVFEVTEETDTPRVLSEVAQPIVDTFGWERLENTQFEADAAGQPATAVASSTPAVGILRVVFGASLEHSNVGATHDAMLIKRRNPGGVDVGLPTDRSSIIAGEFLSMQGHTFLVNNDFVIAEMLVAPIAGQMTLRVNFVDLPFGEYIPPL